MEGDGEDPSESGASCPHLVANDESEEEPDCTQELHLRFYFSAAGHATKKSLARAGTSMYIGGR